MSLALHDERLLRRVGTAVIAAMAAIAIALVTVDDCQLRDTVDVTVYFAHVEGLREGAPLQVAGAAIGEVTAISLVPHGRVAGTDHPLADTGGVAVHVRVETRRAGRAAINGEYFLASRGLFGSRYIEVGPPPGGAERDRGLRDGDALRGVDPAQMDRAMIRTYQNIVIARAFADAVAPEARALMAELGALGVTLRDLEPGGPDDGGGGGAYARTADALGALASEARAVADAWRTAGVTRADLERLLARADDVSARFLALVSESRTTLTRLRGEIARIRGRVPDGVVDRLSAALADAEAALGKLERIGASARDLAARIARGEGTVGGLLNDPEFADDAKSLGKSIKRHPWRLIGRPRRSVD